MPFRGLPIAAYIQYARTARWTRPIMAQLHNVKDALQRRAFFILGIILLLVSFANTLVRTFQRPAIPVRKPISLKDYSKFLRSVLQCY